MRRSCQKSLTLKVQVSVVPGRLIELSALIIHRLQSPQSNRVDAWDPTTCKRGQSVKRCIPDAVRVQRESKVLRPWPCVQPKQPTLWTAWPGGCFSERVQSRLDLWREPLLFGIEEIIATSWLPLPRPVAGAAPSLGMARKEDTDAPSHSREQEIGWEEIKSDFSIGFNLSSSTD